jgi:hypothetical protein
MCGNQKGAGFRLLGTLVVNLTCVGNTLGFHSDGFGT